VGNKKTLHEAVRQINTPQELKNGIREQIARKQRISGEIFSAEDSKANSQAYNWALEVE
jgi:hypothetical protein